MRDEDAIELYRAGNTQQEVADILGLNIHAVWRILRRAGIQARPAYTRSVMDAERWPVALKMRLEGATYAAISQTVGVSLSAVYKALRDRAPKIGRLPRRRR